MADQFSKMYDFERVGGDQRTRLAEMLRANALNAPQGQMVSGWYVAPSWTQNLAQLANTALGTYLGNQVDEERKAKTAELLRDLSQGQKVDIPQVTQNFNGLDQRAEGQTPFPQQPQTELQKIAGINRPIGEQSQINPAMVPQQVQQYRPLTEEEKIGKVMELAQYNPYAANIWSAQDTARQARLTRAEERALDREFKREQLQQQLEGRKDMMQLAATLRPGPQPQAPVAVIDPSTGQEVFVSPSQAYGMRPAKSAQPLSAAQQKEVIEADETIQSSQNVINTLNQALKINPQAYSGFGAKGRAVLRSNLPGESAAADATINLENMMSGQALESLKATFGGNPTEGERKILLDLQASADKTPKQREEIITRAIAAAENRMKFNMQKAEALRGGTYMRPGYSPVTTPSQLTSGMPDMNAIDAEIARRKGR